MDTVEAQHGSITLDGVGCPEELVDLLRISHGSLEIEQSPLNGI